jgi:hypothetical protein
MALQHLEEPKTLEGRYTLMIGYWSKLIKWNCLKASMAYNKNFIPISKNNEPAIIS